MYRNIWFIFILSLFNCHGENKFQVNDHMDDFNEIIEAVIRYDTLKVFKNNKENDVINDYLKKIPIVNPLKPHKDSLALVTPPGSKTLDELFYFSSADYKGFTDKESLYLLSQNSNPDSLKIPSQLLSKIKHLNNNRSVGSRKKGIVCPTTHLKFQSFLKTGQNPIWNVITIVEDYVDTAKDIFLSAKMENGTLPKNGWSG
jgi:hypothetical protein